MLEARCGWLALEFQGDESKVCAAGCESGPVDEVVRNVLVWPFRREKNVSGCARNKMKVGEMEGQASEEKEEEENSRQIITRSKGWSMQSGAEESELVKSGEPRSHLPCRQRCRLDQ